MFENKSEIINAVLVAVDTGEYDAELSLDELEELARTAGAVVVARVCQKRPAVDKATCIGSGRLQELADFCKARAQEDESRQDEDDVPPQRVELVIFDCELTASQIRNIEEIVEVRVIDRTMLILDIFALRATSKEGKVQVELAQQRYRLPRLMGLGTKLSRLGGGIGTRGPGESKLESDRRHIRRRITALEAELRELTEKREDTRRRRKKNSVLTAAIVGYTNVGKSTLLNALTGAEVLAEDKLFATLDPTARALKLPDGRTVVIIDTVGLIRRLPHQLVEAFKSTLEEAANADILLSVCDATSDDCEEQLEVTRELMSEIGAGDTPVITVYNKCDTLGEYPADSGAAVHISAKTGEGFDRLQNAVVKNLEETTKRVTITLPYSEGSLAAQIRDEGKLNEEKYTEDGIYIDAIVDTRTRLFSLLKKYTEAVETDEDR